MIDVHFHCLPGIDDGPEDWEEAVALCRAAAADGAATLVATPHVLRDGWLNEDPGARDQLILKLNTLLGGKPAVLAGCEYAFSSDAVELLEQGASGPLTTLNRGRYLLLEFLPGPLPPSTEAVLHELSLMEVTPVIAHPERNRRFSADPLRLERLVARGALVQITAGSLLGDFGEVPDGACREFFRRGLVHLIASDAHSVGRRPPRLAAARAQVRREWGSAAEAGLFEANPRALLASEPLPWRADRAPVREGSG
ncbi:MAG: tyrosine-protein phosphatase [Thermoanaerobaculia bacterium]